MRGKRSTSDSCNSSIRITPADAGKTKQIFVNRILAEDHPRGCGENSGILNHATSCMGSPPRMRGKPHTFSHTSASPGITPADAGKTCAKLQQPKTYQDHPRGCGENKTVRKKYWGKLGSPPRMRGKRESFSGGSIKGRITPADAGKTRDVYVCGC